MALARSVPVAIAIFATLAAACASAGRLVDSWSQRELALYCQQLKQGMSKRAVDEALGTVGTYYAEVDDTIEPARTYIYWDDPLARLFIGTTVLTYDGDRLATFGRRTTLGDPMALPDCAQPP